MSESVWLKEYLMDQWDYSSVNFSICTLEMTSTFSEMINVEYINNEEMDEVIKSFIYLYFIKYTKDNESIIASHILNIDHYLTEYCKDVDQSSKISTDMDSLIASTIKQHLPEFNILKERHCNSVLNITFPEKYKTIIHIEAKVLKDGL